MTDLERLIQYWQDLIDSGNYSWTAAQCKAVVSTIKALQELKDLKGE